MFKKIVITGGPCAGKTELINCAPAILAQCGYKVFCVPETATYLMAGGHLSPTDDKISFQRAILKLQIAAEDAITDAVNGYSQTCNVPHEKIVLLLDRGALDGKAYLPKSEWEQILAECGFSEDELINRYDAVIHLETASKYNTTAFSDETNSARYENALDAIDVDSRTANAWKNHPRLKIIKATANFQEKSIEFEKHIKEEIRFRA